jgi:transposase-like protein
MKQTETPTCPRCNRNNEVRKIAEFASQKETQPVRDGYILEGIVIRPDSSDWYCSSCSETFGAARVHWGKFLSDRPQ